MKLQKRRKCLHKQLMEISPKVRKWSKVNVPLFPNIPQQFPCSLKVILKYPLFPKSKWGCSLACSLKPLGGPRYCLEVLLLHTIFLLSCPFLVDSGRMFGLLYIVLGRGLQQVTMGPKSLFSFFLQGQYFP